MRRSDTRQRIIEEALHLFASNGYDAVSVSQIAQAVGIKAPSLYKHFPSKRAIFDAIVEHMRQLDAEHAKQAEVPGMDEEEAESEIDAPEPAKLRAFMVDRFRYWTEDGLAHDYRRMLTLEQYKSSENMAMYQKVLGSGPVAYIEDMLGAMLDEGLLRGDDPKRMAIELYAPFFLLVSAADAVESKNARRRVLDIFAKGVDDFMARYKA
ncbi:TetR/AcrR family transcriptional regulator [Bifidobacterium merycicum]|uniref:TetR family Transcriptional regulator n=1 Tax=Bifidobacterium merycicum TaxID=78345 RepID=A0A087BIN2_9BIFI|nr:TetR/AcrR family transcriptional regulator [Bifidobacterium merycicum]KFI70882.1 TetR family Transcriptional regulator [Bifidobacterium merycicum]MBQ1513377.1 TetR/AcrR family transcriptional regulator [Bifidobacterium sp.]MEE1294265.1 helix-turn-helix domain-containing protein [Bifidobacterium merycicum]SHE35074.1 transcriptional regulator, TetR family [Bifidobacterium merycicum DSM 6492]